MTKKWHKKTAPEGAAKNCLRPFFGLLGLSNNVDLEGITGDVNPWAFGGNERLQNNEQHHR